MQVIIIYKDKKFSGALSGALKNSAFALAKNGILIPKDIRLYGCLTAEMVTPVICSSFWGNLTWNNSQVPVLFLMEPSEGIPINSSASRIRAQEVNIRHQNPIFQAPYRLAEPTSRPGPYLFVGRESFSPFVLDCLRSVDQPVLTSSSTCFRSFGRQRTYIRT